MSDRHGGVFWIGHNQLLDLLRWMAGQDKRYWFQFESGELPSGAKVVAVHEDFHLRSFAVLVEHPSLPLVQEGSMLPDLGRLEIKVKVQKPVLNRDGSGADIPVYVPGEPPRD